MKSIIKLSFSWLVLAVCLMATSCNNEVAEVQTAQTSFDDLNFIVNVESGAVGTCTPSLKKAWATGVKKSWAVGDKIVVGIDASDNNLCILQYQGNDEWDVQKYNDQTNFNSDSGSLSAVHADSISIGSDGITTGGDVLYTQSGTYSKHGNVVEINLNMNQRPVSRIVVVGMDDSFRLEGLTEYTKLQSLSTMKWTDVPSSNGAVSREIFGDTCVFYGTLNQSNGNTTIKLVDDYGDSYERTYTGKTANAGDYVIINGPKSAEAGQWKSTILMRGISLSSTAVNMVVGDEYKLTATPYIKEATDKGMTWTIDDSNIATLASDGTIHAVANGRATITVTSNDGSAKAMCYVTVGNIEDFIVVQCSSLTSSFIGMGSWGSVAVGINDFRVYNRYIRAIKLSDSLSFGSSSSTIRSTLSQFSTSGFSPTDVEAGGMSTCKIQLQWPHPYTLSMESSNQNWIGITFTVEGQTTTYSKRVYLPFKLSE